MKPDEYAITTDVQFDALQLIDVSAISASVSDNWHNQTLCRVNDSVVRLGVVQGEFHWHKHDDEDEYFYCVDGELFVDIDEGPTFRLLPRQCVTVPKGVVHRTRAPDRTVILMIASQAVAPTGD